MADLFSQDWMALFGAAWNDEEKLSDALAKISFNSTIGYGFAGEENPRGILVIENGKVVRTGEFNNEALNWDLRATEANWKKWIAKGLGMVGLGAAYTTRKLKFKQGDYSAMVKDPRMAKPFIKSFAVMGRV